MQRRPSRLNMTAFCLGHPKWDQNPKFIPLSKTTSIPTSFIWGVPPPPKGQCSVLTNGPCPMFGHKRQGGGWGLRAEGLKQEERTSLHRIMRWDVKKNSWMLHAPTIDFIITLYMPYSEQRGQCPSTGNIENSPPPRFFDNMYQWGSAE